MRPANEARVGVGIDEHLDVHQVAQRGVGEHQDPLDDECPARLKGVGLRQPGVPREVVLRHFHRLARLERPHVLHHQVGFERVGMVVVERGALLEPQIIPIAVVAVVIEPRHLFKSKAVNNPPHHRGLARARAAGDANHKGRHW